MAVGLEHKAARVGIVAHEVAVWHVDDLLGVESVEGLGRRRNSICYDVVDEIGAHRATKSHELDLYRGRSQNENICPLALRPSIEVEEDVYVLRIDERS